MSTFVHEEVANIIEVFHNRKSLLRIVVPFDAPTAELVAAREEANALVESLKKEQS